MSEQLSPKLIRSKTINNSTSFSNLLIDQYKPVDSTSINKPRVQRIISPVISSYTKNSYFNTFTNHKNNYQINGGTLPAGIPLSPIQATHARRFSLVPSSDVIEHMESPPPLMRSKTVLIMAKPPKDNYEKSFTPSKKLVNQPERRTTSSNGRKHIKENNLETNEKVFKPSIKVVKPYMPPEKIEKSHYFSEYDNIFQTRNPILLDTEEPLQKSGLKVDYLKTKSTEYIDRSTRRVLTDSYISSSNSKSCDNYVSYAAGKPSGKQLYRNASSFQIGYDYGV